MPTVVLEILKFVTTTSAARIRPLIPSLRVLVHKRDQLANVHGDNIDMEESFQNSYMNILCPSTHQLPRLSQRDFYRRLGTQIRQGHRYVQV